MPEIEFAFLSDAADARPGQKFNVLGGGVTRIGGPSFPLVHPHLALVVGLTVAATELGQDHELRFLLLGPGGAELSRAEAQIRADGWAAGGADTSVTFALDLWNLTFADPGDYSLRILIGGSERKRMTLTLERSTASQGSGVVPPFPPPTGRA
ncbi:MAG TPA: hypothetical protein VN800_04080 [Candidatus Acidoferrales bacterium]|nr:hypothetical protein [Candidatus Acidoferrales bacterium]